MTTAELLAHLRRLGVELDRKGDRLVVNAPKGVLTPELQQELKARKPELLAALKPRLEPIPRDVAPPVSFAQQRLWYLNQLGEGGAATYNMPVALRFTGPLDVAALTRAFDAIVARHESLRTSIPTEGGIPVQHIDADLRLELPVVEVDDLDAVLSTEAARPFDLARGPLARATLFRVGADDHVLMFVTHHAIADGLSLAIFQRELVALYTGEQLDPLPVQYADCAAWQRAWLQGDVLAQQTAYWRDQLGGELPVFDLPTDRPRPAVQSFDGAIERLHVPRDLVDALASLGREEGATLFMVMLASFQTLLARHSGRDDIIVGAPIANRTVVEAENVFGLFANTLVLRTDLSGEPAFREVLRRVRATCLGAFEHQDMPFERLVQELEPPRDMSRTPVWQVLFAYQRASVSGTTMGDVAVAPQPIETHHARTDLSFWLDESDDGIHATLEYATALFDRATIAGLLARYEVLLRGIVAAPDTSIARLPLLLDDEVDCNDTVEEYPDTTLHGLIEAQVARTPDAVAVVHGETQLTYRELDDRAARLAGHLRTLGVGPDALVGLLLERSADMVVAALGILKTGAAYLPLDPAYPADRVEFILGDAQVHVTVTQEIVDAAATAAPVPSAAGELAYVIYTSGSTGKPKGVEIPHRAVVNFLATMARRPGLTADDILLAVTTLSFDIAVLELYLPLIVGARTVIAGSDDAADGEELIDLLAESGATVLQATPSTWRLLLTEGWKGDPGLKALCGGEAMPRDLARDLVPRVASLWNMYGPTETTVWSTCYRVEDAEAPILIGRPIGNTEVHVLDTHGQQVPTGVVGELRIGGAGLARGYRNRPELTAARFVDGLYRTGDAVRLRADGNLEYFHRLDDQVKVRGFRIELGEIEAVLATHALVEECVAVVREDRPGDTRLATYYVADNDVTVTELRRHLRGMLPDYMIPQYFVALGALPHTPNGKVDRKALPAPSGVAAAGTGHVAPRSEAETYLAQVWQEELNVDRVGLQDNFFAAGGHSLLSMQMIARVKKETGVRLSPRSVLLHTLEQLAVELAVPVGK